MRARRDDMPKPLAAALDALRQSLWLIPAITMVAALVAAELLGWASATFSVESIPFIFRGGPDAAQALLAAIAGSVITVAGVTFSITIIALQLTSTQFSPRVLRNFMRDRVSQAVFATFLATFVYALMVLGSVRTGSDGREPAVPILAVAGAVVLTLLSIAMLAYFIHHIAHTIQVSTITESVSREALATVRREWCTTDDGDRRVPPTGEETVLDAREGGYLAYAAHQRLVRLATAANAVLRLHLAPGQWVSVGRPLVSVSPPEAVQRLERDPRDEINLAAQPTLQQDVSFGVRQLADIALKALSPSLNDPSTAVNCIHRLTEVLLTAGRGSEPPTTHADDAGVVRLITPQHAFADLVGMAFDQLRAFGAGRLYVTLSMIEALRELADDLPPRHHPPVARQLHLISQAVAAIEVEGDRVTVEREVAELERRLGALPTVVMR